MKSSESLRQEFYTACEDGDTTSMERLLSMSPSLALAKDENDVTPLMVAVSTPERSSKSVRLLIEAGSDVNAQDHDGYTALHRMVFVDVGDGTGNNEAIAELLISAGANVELRQHWGWTPLMTAIVEGTADHVRILLAAGASANCNFPLDTRPEFLAGRTLLMACLSSSESQAKIALLLRAGADTTAEDHFGNSIISYSNDLLSRKDIEQQDAFRQNIRECQQIIQGEKKAEPKKGDGSAL